MKGLVSSASLCLIASSASNAQSTFQDTCIELGSWVFTPAFGDVSSELTAMLAYSATADASGTSLTVLLIEKSGDGWIQYSWSNLDPSVGAASAATHVGATTPEELETIMKALGLDWDPEYDYFTTVENPEPLITAVVESDPLAPGFGSGSFGPEIVPLLVAAGWPASDVVLLPDELGLMQIQSIGDVFDGLEDVFEFANTADPSHVD